MRRVKGPCCSYFPSSSCQDQAHSDRLFAAVDPLGTGRVRGWVGLFRAGMDRIHPRRQEQPRAKPGGGVGFTWRTGDFYLFFYHVTLPGQSFLFCFCFIFWHLDTSANLSLSAHLSLSILRFSTACWEKSLQERSSVFGTPTLSPSGTTSPPRPLPRTTRKVNQTTNNYNNNDNATNTMQTFLTGFRLFIAHKDIEYYFCCQTMKVRPERADTNTSIDMLRAPSLHS